VLVQARAHQAAPPSLEELRVRLASTEDLQTYQPS
jgi:hypothetical protein